MELLYNNGIITMEEKLQIGIVNDEFNLFYQPQYALANKEIVGLEALVRWMHPEEGLISPADFIPVAEETGQIYELERLIVRRALKQKHQWEEEGIGHIELAINLSGKTLASERDFNEIETIISKNDVDYTTVTIEITETAMIENADQVVERLNRLKSRGIKIALDDFGTGYSTLTYLGKFPIDVIKLDRSYVNLIPHDFVDTAIVRNMLKLAQDLNYKVIAEGIETGEQLEYLKEHSCEGGQGFLFSKPLPEDMIRDLIHNI
jgi:EAL domain-containing protein (putative c-di-GMP-specific phosphodiesterase class I)